MNRFRPFVLASLAVAMLIGSVAPAAAAPGPGTSSNATEAVFVGTATSGVGAPMPIDINPADVSFRSDGAIGIGYIYTAVGETHGKAAGRFVYEERGYLYFRNPADPTSYVGSQFRTGVFTLTLRKGGVVTIADTNPAAYTSGVNTVNMPEKGISKALREMMGKKGVMGPGGTLTYGYFTFHNNYGEFKGYATPDFRQFLIRITFDCPVC